VNVSAGLFCTEKGIIYWLVKIIPGTSPIFVIMLGK
jgi:hypothetical protein